MDTQFPGVWLNDVPLLCALGETGPVSQIVADFIVNDVPCAKVEAMMRDKEEFYHEHLDKVINLKKWRNFLKEKFTSLAEIRKFPVVTVLHDELKKIAQGANMKDAGLSNFWKFFERHLMMIPSTNQFVELMFKLLSDIASVKGWSEEQKSLYVKFIVTAQFCAKKLASIRADVKQAANGMSEEALEARRKVSTSLTCGDALFEALIQVFDDILETAKSIPDFDCVYAETYAAFFDKKKHFSTAHAVKQGKDYLDKCDRKVALNKIAATTGADVTDLMSGNPLFPMVMRKHLNLFRQDLGLQGLKNSDDGDFNDRTKITELKDLLKSELGFAKEAKYFKPISVRLLEACHSDIEIFTSAISGEIEETLEELMVPTHEQNEGDNELDQYRQYQVILKSLVSNKSGVKLVR